MYSAISYLFFVAFLTRIGAGSALQQHQQNWEKPLKLFELVDGKLKLNPETAQIVGKIDQSLTVIAIAGPARTGKSYLMNALQRTRNMKTAGFKVESGTTTVTEGIWVMKMSDPNDSKNTYLLMDTEGFGGYKKKYTPVDTWIGCLAILLSHIFIFNTMHSIGGNVIDQLSYTSEIVNKISSDSTSHMLMQEMFPAFVLVIQDFYLEDREEARYDEYLEDTLAYDDGQSQQKESTKQILKSKFVNRKCFCLTRPANANDHLRNLDTIPEEKLTELYRKQIEQLRNDIFQQHATRRISKSFDGTTFIKFANNILKMIEVNGIPSVTTIHSLFTTIKRLQSELAIEKQVHFYETNVRDLVTFPISQERLNQIHQKVMEIARDALRKKLNEVNPGEIPQYITQFEKGINAKYEKFQRENNQKIREQERAWQEQAKEWRKKEETKHLLTLIGMILGAVTGAFMGASLGCLGILVGAIFGAITGGLAASNQYLQYIQTLSLWSLILPP